MSQSPTRALPEPRPRAEEDRLPARRLVVLTATGVAVAAVAILVARCLLAFWSSPGTPQPETKRAPAGSAGLVEQSLILTTRRGLDLAEEQRRSLDRLGWVDRDRHLAQIPIDVAIGLVSDPAFSEAERKPWQLAGAEAPGASADAGAR